MPPKVKFTKEQIIDAAICIVREGGISALSSRTLGKKLGTSSCPVFTAFENMEEVQREVLNAANRIYQTYLQKGMSDKKYPPYKASGMAYIGFAKDERELFKFLFMRDRTGEKVEENREEIRPILEIIKKSIGLEEEEAYLFHVELWIYVHGIATMIASSYLDWDMDFVSRALTDVYEGLKHRYLFLQKGSGMGDSIEKSC